MKVISIINGKGGVAKTASAVTLAHMIATIHEKKVLLIDLDPQGNTSGIFSQTDFMEIFFSILERRKADTELSVEDVLMNPDLDIHEAIRHTDYDGLDIIPSHLTLSECEERLKADITSPQQFKLRAQLQKVKDEYDFVIIDCSPSISILNINGLTASDEVYIPLCSDGNSCIGMAITNNLVKTVSNYNPGLKIAGVFMTRYDARKNVSRTIYELLEKILPEYNIPLLPITIPVTKLLEENTFEQKPLLEVDCGRKKVKATLAYMDLAEYVVAPNKKLFLKNYNANKENQ